MATANIHDLVSLGKIICLYHRIGGQHRGSTHSLRKTALDVRVLFHKCIDIYSNDVGDCGCTGLHGVE